MTAVSTYPAEAAPLVEALLGGVRDALGDNIVGVYLTGSLALGGFVPETSDVDILVATERPISEAELETLAAFHESLPAEGNRFGRAYEVYYIDRKTLRRYVPGSRHVKLGVGEEFGWKLHRANWLFERWTLREHGIVVRGPDPQTLIDPVTADELRDAARSELQIRIFDWPREWKDGEDPAPWISRRAFQAFEIETVCRALYTIARGELSTKRAAVEWALRDLPDEWQPLVRWSQEHRADKAEDVTMVPEIIRFVRWAAGEAGVV